MRFVHTTQLRFTQRYDTQYEVAALNFNSYTDMCFISSCTVCTGKCAIKQCKIAKLTVSIQGETKHMSGLQKKLLGCKCTVKSETAFTLKSISDSNQVKHCQTEKNAARMKHLSQVGSCAREAPEPSKFNYDVVFSTKNVFLQKNGPINVDCHVYEITDLHKYPFSFQMGDCLFIWSCYTILTQLHYRNGQPYPTLLAYLLSNRNGLIELHLLSFYLNDRINS